VTRTDQRAEAQSRLAHLLGLTQRTHGAQKRHCWLRGRRHRWTLGLVEERINNEFVEDVAYVCRDCGRRA
jgi:hypothetical protein